MEEKVRYFMFSYMYPSKTVYGYGRYLVTIKGALKIYKVEEYIAKEKGIDKVLVTGFVEITEEDFNANCDKDL